MTKRRSVLAAAFALTALGGGIAASSVAQAHQPVPAKMTTTTQPVYTVAPCVDGVGTYGGGGCPTSKATTTTTAAATTTIKPRTKNAALPTTTTIKPPANAVSWRVVNGVAVPTVCKAGYVLKAGACVAGGTTTSSTTTTPRTKNKAITSPSPAPRTKNAALTTTAVPRPVTTPLPPIARTGTTRVPTSNTLTR